MPKLVIVPNKMRSRSAKALADTLSHQLGYRVYRVTEGRVRERTPFKLSKGIDKLTQLKRFNKHGIEHPEFTTDRNIAVQWIADGSVVVCRTLTRASEGRGIVISENPEQLVRAPLYTKYVPKKAEYRVHVFDGNVIDLQQKKKRKGFKNERNTRIRNLANGYVFCRDGLVEPEGIRELAISATSALDYRIGAVDIAHNVKKDKLVVLEVNANPGLQGQTLVNYAFAIKQDHLAYTEFCNYMGIR